jgi:hypothetical protein
MAFCPGTPKWKSRNSPQSGFPQLWGRITSCADLLLRWGVKQSYSPYWKFSNGMLHIVYTLGNQIDSGLLVVGSQIVNFTPGLSFGHNLCFRCPNAWWEPMWNIYVSINFQCYKELFKVMDFDPCNHALKIW